MILSSATANDVDHDLGLQFQDKEFWNVNISKTVRAREKMLRCDIYRGWYSSSNETMVNAVLRDLDLPIQGKNMSHRHRWYETVRLLWCWQELVNYVNYANYVNYVHNVFVRPCVRACVLHKKCYYCTAIKRLHLEAPFLTHVSLLTTYLCLPIFIQIVSVLDLHFERQRFESSTFGSSHVIILKMMTGRTLPLPTQKVTCGLSIAISTLDLGPF